MAYRPRPSSEPVPPTGRAPSPRGWDILHHRGGLLMVSRKARQHEYPDDIFADTRMTFGEHIEELRTRMIRAIMWLLVFLVLGFILDAVGEAVGRKQVGIGRPMMEVITDPVETQVRDFDNRRNVQDAAQKLASLTNTPDEEIERIREKLRENGWALSDLTEDERQKLLGAPQPMPMVIPT